MWFLFVSEDDYKLGHSCVGLRRHNMMLGTHSLLTKICVFSEWSSQQCATNIHRTKIDSARHKFMQICNHFLSLIDYNGLLEFKSNRKTAQKSDYFFKFTNVLEFQLQKKMKMKKRNVQGKFFQGKTHCALYMFTFSHRVAVCIRTFFFSADKWQPRIYLIWNIKRKWFLYFFFRLCVSHSIDCYRRNYMKMMTMRWHECVCWKKMFF